MLNTSMNYWKSKEQKENGKRIDNMYCSVTL